MKESKIIDISNRNDWDNIVKSFSDYDIYYLSGYLKGFQVHGDGIPQLFYYTNKSVRSIYVYLKRATDIANIYDSITPYGYGGFLIEGATSENDIKEMWDSYITAMSNENIICNFVRYSPILQNANPMRTVTTVIDLGKTISMDLESPEIIWTNITSKNRNMIRKAENNGVEIHISDDPKLFTIFKEIYDQTMINDNADNYYFFKKEFYDSIATDLKGNYQIAYATYNNQIISMAIIIYANNKLHYHLSGSIYEYRNLAPSNLLLYKVALWGYEHGFKSFHLGGGIGSGEDNLYKFKSAFNRKSDNQFSIGKEIFDNNKYNDLVKMRVEKDLNFDLNSKYFPLYRSKNMKKLLIIGSSNAEVNVIKIAQSMGYYVITTDYYTDKNLAPAKDIADEAWDISWTDYDELEKKCKESGIDGIIAGFSEFRVESMIEMCNRLNLPCYINKEQLDITRDKSKFKKLCKEFCVPVVNDYEPNSTEIKFPVIIKPTDRGGSIGINVAFNQNEYTKYLEYAYSMSPSKNVVIEDYIGDGIKFDCSYYISENDAVLIETCDTTMLSNEKGFETLQKAWTFPSIHEQEYIEQVNENVISMLKSLGMNCGVANISFFYRNGKFYAFETGFRLGGGHSFDYQRASNGIDFLSCMIKYALGEPIDANLNIPNDRGFALTYNIYFKSDENDIVNQVIGEDDVKTINEVVTYIPNLYHGYKISNNKPNKIAMCTLYAKNLDTIIKDVEFINRTLKVKTKMGISPIFCELTTTEIINAITK